MKGLRLSKWSGLRRIKRLWSLSRRILFRCTITVHNVPTVRLGSHANGWILPASVLQEGNVAVCAGAGEDITFDLALVERGLTVLTVDPTPRAIAHVASQKIVSEGFHFVPIGVWDERVELFFHAPANASEVSHSALNLQNTDTGFRAEVDTVESLVQQYLGGEVNILKLDIEGAEVRVLRSVLASTVRPNVIAFEFDQPQKVRILRSLCRELRMAGYLLIAMERWNLTFQRS